MRMTSCLILVCLLVVAKAKDQTSVIGSSNGAAPECTLATSATDCPLGTQCMKIRRGFSGKSAFQCWAPLAAGDACDPSLLDLEACQTGLSCQKDKCHKNREDCSYTCQLFEQLVANCTSRIWELRYEHTSYGVAVNGNLDGFVAAIQRGDDVKYDLWMYEESFSVQKVTYHQTEHKVAFQALIIPVDRVYDMFFISSTDGYLEREYIERGIPYPEPYFSDLFLIDAKYFTRPRFHQVSDISQLRNFIKNGASVKVCVENQYFELHNVAMDSATVSASIPTVQAKFHRKQHGECKLVEQSNDLTLTWFVDFCWEIVYKTNGAGNAVFGSASKLLESVKAGRRIKVRIGDTFHQASFITINNDVVTIHVLDSMNNNLQDPTWHWLLVSSNGHVATIRLKIGDGNAMPDRTDETVELAWFVELRNWSVGIPLSVVNGSGDRQFIRDAVNAGRDIRFMIKNTNGNELYYESNWMYQRNSFYSRQELVEKNGVFYQRYSIFDVASSSYRYRDWKAEAPSQAPGDSATRFNVPSVWFIGE